jgi:hypothetical protein
MARVILPTCFVIMPFGKKIVGDLEIDFDQIYTQYIEPAGIDARFKVRKADTEKVGLIIPQMMNDISTADLVVADVTYYNPNVYYELGIRHVLRRNGTILVRRKSGNLGVRKLRFFRRAQEGEIPFDINWVNVRDYDFSKASLQAEIKSLSDRMSSAVRATDTDSPVYQCLKTLRVSAGSGPAAGRKDRTYEIAAAPGKFIGFRSGDIENLRGKEAVDFWVNSENTLMQMARVWERSVSSTIRHLGARSPDPKSPDFEDTIADALKARMGNKHVVDPGDVLVTTSGRLAQTHGVKAVLHAATVVGAPREGFTSIRDDQLVKTVGRVIATARELIRKGDPAQAEPSPMLAAQSLIMPLFGTGQAGRDPATIASRLIAAAIESLSHDPDAGPFDPDLKLVLFSAYTDDDVSLLRRLFESFVADGDLKPATKGDAD